jgi:hypothetical protein
VRLLMGTGGKSQGLMTDARALTWWKATIKKEYINIDLDVYNEVKSEAYGSKTIPIRRGQGWTDLIKKLKVLMFAPCSVACALFVDVFVCVLCLHASYSGWLDRGSCTSATRYTHVSCSGGHASYRLSGWLVQWSLANCTHVLAVRCTSAHADA